MTKRDKGLGKGLNALFASPEIEEEIAGQGINEIDIDIIVPNRLQPRKNFDDSSLKELSESIQQHGVLQPVLLRASGSGYELIAGERRWRAARIAGLKSIPAVVKEIDDNRAAEIALVENLQRDDLSVVEEATAYRNLLEKHDYTHEMLAEKLGKSRVHITNTMRLLGLSPEVLVMLEQKKITAGHARALLSIEDPEEQLVSAQEIANGKVSVRETEKKVKERKKRISSSGTRERLPEINDIEERLQSVLGCKVQIQPRGIGGSIEISYYDSEELDRIIEIIGI